MSVKLWVCVCIYSALIRWFLHLPSVFLRPPKLTAEGPQNDGPWKAGDSGFKYSILGMYLC